MVHRHLVFVCFASLVLLACAESDPGPADAADVDMDGDAGAADGDSGAADGDSGAADGDSGAAVGAGIFLEGCPVPGKAYARQIANSGAAMHGPHVMAGQGDWLLVNERAAFAITDPSFRKSYWYYDGVVVDAVAVDGCAQAGEERFEELVPMVAQVDIGDFASSILRGFHVDYLEVLQDGSDGADAIIRAHGSDDLFWLIDQVFAESRFKAGVGDGLSEPLGLEMWVDYILAPGSSVLRIELGVRNVDPEPKPIAYGVGLWVGDTTRRFYYTAANLGFGGYELDIGAPWFGAESVDGDGAYAIALEKSATATVSISGVQALLDSQLAFATPQLGPIGEPDDSLVWPIYVAVGPTDGNSATRELHSASQELVSGEPHTLETINGSVIDAVGGGPLADVSVLVERQNTAGEWHVLDMMRSDAEGLFEGQVAYFGEPETYRLTASKLGMPDAAPVMVALPGAAPAQIALGRPGTLQLDVRNSDGQGLPCRVMLYDASSLQQRRRILSATGGESVLVAPGEYAVSVLRGIEYSPSEQILTVTADQTTTLSATLDRVIDTSGFLLMDSHVHGGPSPDSNIVVAQRVLTAAADGCEVPVNTDHEFILDYQPTVVQLGLDSWVRQVTGEEVTPSLPEHINMFPVVPTTDEDARGGIVKWYGKDIDAIFSAISARGAGIIQLNHPRLGCNYMCTIGYDRLTGMPTEVPDPTQLGFAADAQMWSWDFNAIELMNGFKNIYLDPSSPDDTGLFDDWMSFFNLGHRITGMGVTDTHGISGPCQPGTYFASSTDDPNQLDEAELVDSILNQRALLTTGAFARVTVNGTASMGDTITDGDGTVDLALRIEAIPEIDVAFFKVLVNCDQVATVATSSPGAVVKYDGTISVEVTADAHIVVLGFGIQPMPRGLRSANPSTSARFISNPVFVDTDGNGQFDAPGGKTCTYDLSPP